ncbi:MAG TPA: ankyrin repeat domain-containing protein [Rhizomicrobium sp.]|nr:ankyrin repeat domain-containing protein [Rhizomicrobium sp.]
MDTKGFFALADADDAAGLETALTAAPETFRLRNETGETLFLYCVFRGKMKCAELLKRRGGQSLHEAALSGDAKRVTELAKTAPWAVDTLSPDGWTALHLAAFLGQGDALVALLSARADARVFGRAFESNLPIHAAAAGGRLDKAAFAKLVAATGNPDVLQKAGYTALMIAAANGFTDAVNVLLAAGASKTIKTPEGKTAADFARERGHDALVGKLS